LGTQFETTAAAGRAAFACRILFAKGREARHTMLHITNDAKQICSATIRQMVGEGAVKCLRLIRNDDGASISFEVPRSGDEIVEHKGLTVLAIPQPVAQALAGMTLDVNEDGRFVIS
jgi:hypothetical protein